MVAGVAPNDQDGELQQPNCLSPFLIIFPFSFSFSLFLLFTNGVLKCETLKSVFLQISIHQLSHFTSLHFTLPQPQPLQSLSVPFFLRFIHFPPRNYAHTLKILLFFLVMLLSLHCRKENSSCFCHCRLSGYKQQFYLSVAVSAANVTAFN